MTMNKLSCALITALASLSLSACGGGGGSGGNPEPPEPEVVSYDITDLNKGFYSNKLYCNQSSSDEKAGTLCGLRIYQIMVEAFNNGDDSINYDVGYGTSDHKGDIQGVIDQLDYIKGLGVNAIWLTPVFQSALLTDHTVPLDATGYFAQEYFKVDPHFGSEDTLKKLIDEAHSRGMYVFLDGVYGHFKDNIQRISENGSVLNQTETCQGSTETYEAGDGTLCAAYDFPGSTGTEDFFRDVATYYIKEYKIFIILIQ
ncbi:MAG: alpha-amylase family glycosyl hydrolase, partial [Succinimonas sp.]|nr:alpha-amylase family glycosyl hydrolase [Succinimonas sp.]